MEGKFLLVAPAGAMFWKYHVGTAPTTPSPKGSDNSAQPFQICFSFFHDTSINHFPKTSLNNEPGLTCAELRSTQSLLG